MENHGLVEVQSEDPLFSLGRLFTKSRTGGQPWWVDFLSVPPVVSSQGGDALAFLQLNGRWLYLSFGFAYSKVLNEAAEYDFSMKATAALVLPDALRSADSVEPNAGRRTRTQTNQLARAGEFGIDRRAALIRGLTGTPRDSLNETLKQVTAGSLLKIRSSASAAELPWVLAACLAAYLNGSIPDELESYLQLRPVEDPTILASLEDRLLTAFRDQNLEQLSLIVPATVDYGVRDHVQFFGQGKYRLFDEVFVGSLFEYLENRQTGELTIDLLSRMKMQICDQDGNQPEDYPLYKSLFFECTLPENQSQYFLSEGKWYQVSTNLIARLRERLRPYFVDNDFPEFAADMDSEATYNLALAEHIGGLCLDKEDILPWTRSQIEPCDIMKVEDDQLRLIHVKRGTTSSTLSHLLNQGVNSWRVIRDDDEVREKFLELSDQSFDRGVISDTINNRNVKLEYVITTHKPIEAKEENLPIFSRISADRVVSEAEDIGLTVEFTYVVEPRNNADHDDDDVLDD